MLGCHHCGRSFTSSRALFAHLSVCEVNQHADNVAGHPRFNAQQLCDAVSNVTTPTTAISVSSNNDQGDCVQSQISGHQTKSQSTIVPTTSPIPNNAVNMLETNDLATLDIETELVNVDCNSESGLVPSCEGTHVLQH